MPNTSATTWTVAHQAPLSMGFSRQEYQKGLPFPTPGNLPEPGIEHTSPALAGRFYTTEPPRKFIENCFHLNFSVECGPSTLPQFLFKKHLTSSDVYMLKEQLMSSQKI